MYSKLNYKYILIDLVTIKGWHVPQFHLPKAETANQLWPTQKSMKTNKTKPIPENVFDKIMYHAVHDEKDVLTKAGIIIQSQTGLRINEVLSINGNGEVLNFTTGDMLVCVTNESMMYGKASLSTASKDELIIGNTTIAYYNILAIGIAEKIVVS